MTLTLRETYDTGGFDPSAEHGNVLERVTAEQDGDSWVVVTCDGAGTELDRRTATDDEAAQWSTPAPQPETPAAPAEVDTLRDQVATLTARLDALMAALGS